MIPNDWQKASLASVLDKIIDYRGQSVPKSDSGIPLITARNVRNGYLDFTNLEFVDESQYEGWMTRGLPQAGDVLITTEAPLGMVALYPTSSQKYAVGQRTVTLRPSSRLNAKFLMYYLLGPGSKEIHDRSTGSTVKGIKSSELKKVSVSFPSPPEQEKIVKIISTWDEAIDKVERLIKMKSICQVALMRELLTGKKRLNGFTQAWEEKYLKDTGVFSKGKGISKGDLSDGLIPCVRYGELYTRHHFNIKNFYSFISEDVALNSTKLKKGDILFAGSGETLEDIGKCASFILDAEAYAGGDIIILSPNLEMYDSQFLGFFLNSDLTRKQIHKLGQGQTVVHVYPSSLETLQFKFPCLKEQRRIGEFLFIIENEIGHLKKAKSLFHAQKKVLMKQLLTGKKRVK